MRARRWLLFIVLNIVVSVVTTLAVLSIKGGQDRVVVVTGTPGAVPAVAVSAASAAEETVEATSSPTTVLIVEYTIQAGDTLGGIALAYNVSLEELLGANNLTEDDIIKPGQQLIIPRGATVALIETSTPTRVAPSPVPPSPTPSTPVAFPTETPTPPGPVQVRIQEVLAPGALAREGVVLVNRGRTVNLLGWKLQAAGGDDAYEFPRLTLAQEVPVTVYTIAGTDSPEELHWGKGTAQWGDSGIVIELRDADGDLIAAYTVP